MNATPPHAEAPDDLDRLLSEFFKAQLKQPWPNAPVPAAKPTEPSELVAQRAADTPRNTPSPSRRDNSARARFTLAASVALMLGTCWYLSNGFQPGSRPVVAPPGKSGLLPESGAGGPKGGVLDTIQENKAKGDHDGPKIDMGKFE
jgi:hypothetical protein